MKILVATTRSQGMRSDDFSHTVPGELVVDFGPCSDDPLGQCVFGRAFVGLGSGHLTTTAAVVDLPFLDRRSYLRVLRESVIPLDFQTTELVTMAEGWRRLAGDLPVGTVVERRGGKTRVRAGSRRP